MERQFDKIQFSFKAHLFGAISVVVIGGLGFLSDFLSLILPNIQLSTKTRILLFAGLVFLATIYLCIILFMVNKEISKNYNDLLSYHNQHLDKYNKLANEFKAVRENRDALNEQYIIKSKLINQYKECIDTMEKFLFFCISHPSEEEKQQILQLIKIIELYKESWRDSQ